jgi:hypothetical protein
MRPSRPFSIDHTIGDPTSAGPHSRVCNTGLEGRSRDGADGNLLGIEESSSVANQWVEIPHPPATYPVKTLCEM